MRLSFFCEFFQIVCDKTLNLFHPFKKMARSDAVSKRNWVVALGFPKMRKAVLLFQRWQQRLFPSQTTAVQSQRTSGVPKWFIRTGYPFQQRIRSSSSNLVLESVGLRTFNWRLILIFCVKFPLSHASSKAQDHIITMLCERWYILTWRLMNNTHDDTQAVAETDHAILIRGSMIFTQFLIFLKYSMTIKFDTLYFLTFIFFGWIFRFGNRSIRVHHASILRDLCETSMSCFWPWMAKPGNFPLWSNSYVQLFLVLPHGNSDVDRLIISVVCLTLCRTSGKGWIKTTIKALVIIRSCLSVKGWTATTVPISTQFFATYRICACGCNE